MSSGPRLDHPPRQSLGRYLRPADNMESSSSTRLHCGQRGLQHCLESCNSNLHSVPMRITIELMFEEQTPKESLMSPSTPAHRSESELRDVTLPSADASPLVHAFASADGIRQGKRWPERRRLRRVRIRVNARGAAYVPGLQEGRVYDAKIKVRWPGTAWPLRTGLSHRFFLLAGMYEIVQDEEQAARSTRR